MKRLAGRRPRVKLSHDELIRRLRLGDVRKLVQDRCGAILADDDAGREYLKEILLPISLWPYEARRERGRIVLFGPTDKMRCEIKRWAPWMGDDEAQELLDDINLTPARQRKPKPMTLGKRLNLTYAERARLLLRTIGPCDVTEKAMAMMCKQKKRQTWMITGESRATYYRRIKQEQARETSVCHINLIQTEHIPGSKEEHSTDAGYVSVCRRPPLLGRHRPVQNS
jgi:hypothetical protein